MDFTCFRSFFLMNFEKITILESNRWRWANAREISHSPNFHITFTKLVDLIIGKMKEGRSNWK